MCRTMSDTGHSTDGRRCGLVSIGLALALIASVLLIEVSGVGRLPVSGEFRFGRLSIRLAAAGTDSQGNPIVLAPSGAPEPAAEAGSAASQGGQPASPAQQAEAKPAEAGSSTEPEQGSSEGEQPPEAGDQPQSEREPGGTQADAGEAQEPEQLPAAGEQQREEAQPTSAEGGEQGHSAEADAQPEAQQPPEGRDQAAEGEEQPGPAGQSGTDTSEARGAAAGQQAAEGQLLGPEQAPEGGDQQHVLQPSGPVFTCKDSGFCSVGQVRPWRGDVATNEALREMLEAVAFKKEVIMTLLGSPGPSLQAQMALNLATSALQLGLAHFFILARGEHVCGSMPERYSHVSCVWDSRPEAAFNPGFVLDGFLEKRWELAARMLRMGFNVLSIDTDAMLHHDPYVFLKAPPLNRYTSLFQQDGADGATGAGVNCGVMYWQGAHPAGPSTWMAVEHADRAFRQRENETHMTAVYPGWHPGYTWEQAAWPEMVASAAAGRPQLMHVENIISDEARAQWEALMKPSGWERLQCETVEWPKRWHHVTGAASTPLCFINDLIVPRPPNQQWWRDNARWFFPLDRGNASEAFMQLVRSASDVPYPEMELPWEAPEPPIPPEHFVYLPQWFATGYAARGALGFFGGTDPPAQVASHLIYLPGNKAWKAYLFRGMYWWHWDVTEAFTGGNVLGLESPRLLMLAPGLQLRTRTEPGFAQEVAKLARLAQALGRALVVPSPPCDSDWVGVWRAEATDWLRVKNEEATVPLWDEIVDGYQVLRFPDTQRPGHTYCHWRRFLDGYANPNPEPSPCFNPAAFVQHADAAAFLRRSLPPEQAQPSEANTLYYQRWAAAGGVDAHGPAAALIADEADAAAVMAAAAGMEAAPVLFLGAVPRIANDASLPHLEPPAAECDILRPGLTFEVNEEGQKNRAALVEQRRAASGARRGMRQAWPGVMR